ncbi:MAG TPA: penicillin-binding protein 2, partial [Bacillota bacterium]|nr:penicillin-binding protein 2 [Bacillota bacterium]
MPEMKGMQTVMHRLRRRTARIIVIFLFCFGGLIFKCWEIQVGSGGRYASLALGQSSAWVSLEEAPRGRILDRNLSPITDVRLENRVVVFPEVIRDRGEVSEGLSEILGVAAGEISRSFEGGPCRLPYRVTSEQAAAITAKGWTGVKVFPVQYRYGEKPLAVHLIGHLGRISSRGELSSLAEKGKKIYRFDDLVGKAGLEKCYEQDLKGLRPQMAARVLKDAFGRLLGGPEYIFEDRTADGERRDVVLTVDSKIQAAVEDVMDLRVQKG